MANSVDTYETAVSSGSPLFAKVSVLDYRTEMVKLDGYARTLCGILFSHKIMRHENNSPKRPGPSCSKRR